MYYRDFKDSDLSEIIELKRLFYTPSEMALPDPRRNSISSVVIADNDKIVAFGVIKLFAEAVMVLDQRLPARQKVAILKHLMNQAITDSKNYGIEVLHVFSQRDDFLKILKKHYNFADNNKAISLNLEG